MSNRDAILRYLDGYNKQDAEAVVATFAKDGTYTDPLTPLIPAIQVSAMCAQLFVALPDVTFEVTDLLDGGQGRFALHYFLRGTTPSGRQVTMGGADFILVEDGKLRSVVGYFDSGTYLRQIGVAV